VAWLPDRGPEHASRGGIMISNANTVPNCSWTQDAITAINNEVHTVAGGVQQTRTVFHPQILTTPIMQYGSVVNQVMEIFNEAQLPGPSVTSEPNAGSAMISARQLSVSVAQAEEMLIWQGNAVQLPQGVAGTNLATAGGGIIGAVGQHRQAHRAGAFGLMQAVVEGINDLAAIGRAGPYALFVSPAIAADAQTRFVPETSVTVAAWLSTYLQQPPGSGLPGGMYTSVGLPATVAVLVALPTQPLMLGVFKDTQAYDPIVAAQNAYLFKVSESFHFVVTDPHACVRIDYVPAAAAPGLPLGMPGALFEAEAVEAPVAADVAAAEAEVALTDGDDTPRR